MISRYFTHKPRAHKYVADDPQRHKVYTMEKSIVGWCVNTSTSRESMLDVIKHACKYYKVPAPRLKLVKQVGQPFGWCIEGAIELNRAWHGNNMGVMLHELAHHIIDETAPDAETHGPTFMEVYAYLLDKYKMLPRVCLDALAEQYDVQVGGLE